MTENLYTFLQVLALFCLFESLSRSSTAWAVVSGLVMVLAMATRPVGKALPLALLCALPFLWREFRARVIILIVLASCLVGSLGACGLSKMNRGFFGFEQMANVYLAGLLLPHLDVEMITEARLRESLRPFFTPERRAEMRNDTNWVRFDSKGPRSFLQNDPVYSKNADQIVGQLNRNAFWHAPLAVFADLFRLGGGFILFGAQLQDRGVVRKEVGFMDTLNRIVPYVRVHPELHSLLHLQARDAAAFVSKLEHTPVFPFEPGRWFDYPAWWLRNVYPVLPVLGFISICLAKFWAPPSRRIILLIAPVIVLQIGMMMSGGAWVWRFSYPYEPLYTLVLMGAIATFIPKLQAAS